MSTWMWLLTLSILTQVIAEISAKSYSLSGQMWVAAVTLALNTLSSLFWIAYIRDHSALAVGAGIWAVAISVAALFIGAVMYGESIEIRQYIGSALGIVALLLLI